MTFYTTIRTVELVNINIGEDLKAVLSYNKLLYRIDKYSVAGF